MAHAALGESFTARHTVLDIKKKRVSGTDFEVTSVHAFRGKAFIGVLTPPDVGVLVGPFKLCSVAIASLQPNAADLSVSAGSPHWSFDVYVGARIAYHLLHFDFVQIPFPDALQYPAIHPQKRSWTSHDGQKWARG